MADGCSQSVICSRYSMNGLILDILCAEGGFFFIKFTDSSLVFIFVIANGFDFENQAVDIAFLYVF